MLYGETGDPSALDDPAAAELALELDQAVEGVERFAVLLAVESGCARPSHRGSTRARRFPAAANAVGRDNRPRERPLRRPPVLVILVVLLFISSRR